MSDDLQATIDLFVNRTDLYYKQEIIEGKCQYYPGIMSIKEAVDLHLAGKITIGLPAKDTDALCKWACWDSDVHDGAIVRVKQQLEGLNFFPIRESIRDGRDGHLWLFFDQKVKAMDLCILNNYIQLSLGIEMEFFPKSPWTDKANGVRMPLGINRKPEAKRARGWFDIPDKNLQAQVTWLLAQPRSSSEKLSKLAQVLETIGYRSHAQGARIQESTDCASGSAGNYYVLSCPSCEQNTAYSYFGSNIVTCNRRNKCGYKGKLNAS